MESNCFVINPKYFWFGENVSVLQFCLIMWTSSTDQNHGFLMCCGLQSCIYLTLKTRHSSFLQNIVQLCIMHDKTREMCSVNQSFNVLVFQIYYLFTVFLKEFWLRIVSALTSHKDKHNIQWEPEKNSLWTNFNIKLIIEEPCSYFARGGGLHQ